MVCIRGIKYNQIYLIFFFVDNAIAEDIQKCNPQIVTGIIENYYSTLVKETFTKHFNKYLEHIPAADILIQTGHCNNAFYIGKDRYKGY